MKPSPTNSRRHGLRHGFAALLTFTMSLGLAGAHLHAATPELVTRDDGLRTLDTVELFRNGVYWWTSSSCSGDVINPGGASFMAYTDPRILSASATLFGVPAGSSAPGGFRPGDHLDLGVSIKDRASALRGVLLPDCGYGAHFVRNDEAFYYAYNRQLHRKPLGAPAVAPGEIVRFRIGIEPFPVPADGVVFATERELWSYAADLRGNTLTLQRSWKPSTRDFSAPREILTLPGVSVRKFTIVDIQASDGTYLGSELLLLTPDGTLHRAGVDGGNPRVVRRGVTDFAVRNESYLVRGNLGLTSRRRSTTLYAALGHPVTHTGPSQVLGLDLTPGGRGEFVEYTSGAGLRITSLAVDKNHLFLTRTPAGNPASSELLRRRAPAEPTVANAGDPDYTTLGFDREYRSLRSSGRMVYFAHANTVQRIPVGVPSIDLDYEAFALEASQAIQNLQNTVPLVAGKRVFVRGYSRLKTDSAGRGAYDVPAVLRVYHAPATDVGQGIFQEVAGSPFLPVVQPQVVPVGSLVPVRTNLAATFVFEVPESVVKAGDLRFAFHLNPDRTAPETGDQPLANNTVVASLKVRETLVLPLTMVPVLCKEGLFDPADPGSRFWDQMARAQSLLPFPALRIGFRNPPVTKSAWEVVSTKTATYDLPGEKDAAIAAVDSARVLDGNPLGGSYVGMVPMNTTNFGGYGRRPGQAILARMAPRSYSSSPWNTLMGGLVVAHEFGHNSGFRHIPSDLTCGFEIPLPSEGIYDHLPNDASPCTLGLTDLEDPATATGFDPLSWTIPLPGSNGDLMSYANPLWISEYNWKRLFEIYSFRFPAGSPAASARALQGPPEGDLLLVQGLLDEAGRTLDLSPALTLPAASLSADNLAELTGPADNLPEEQRVSVQLLDEAGNVLVDQAAPLHAFSEGPPRLLRRALPMPETARSLRVRNASGILTERTISAHPPAVILGPPTVRNDRLELTWTATDPDGDTPLFTTQISTDDGATWKTLRQNASESGLDLEVARLPGGNAVRLRVLATDGIRSSTALSEAFALPRQKPIARIAAVSPNQILEFGAVAQAQGFGHDAEDGGLPETALGWVLSGPVNVERRGASFPLAELPPGQYRLELTATDSDGGTGTDSVRFTVRALPILEGAEPVLDGLCADPAYGATPGIRLGGAGLGTGGRLRFVHSRGALFASFTGLPYAAADSPGSIAGLRIKTADADPAVAVTAGFAVTEHGVLLRTRQENGNFTTLTNPPTGFTVVLLRDENSWSAEMRITDELLGGWKDSFSLAAWSDDGLPATAPAAWPPQADPDNPGTWSGAHAGALPPTDPSDPTDPTDPGADKELVRNGGFENTGGTFNGGDAWFMSLPVGSTVIPGWTTISAGLTWVSNGGPQGVESPEGRHFLDLTGDHDAIPYAGVTQEIATVPGRRYRLSVSLGAHEDIEVFRGPVSVSVTFGSETREVRFEPAGAGNQWAPFSLEFTATLATTPITLLGTFSKGGQFLGLDRVSVVEIPPDPTALELSITAVQGADLRLSFVSRPGRSYVVESTQDLPGGPWTPVPQTSVTGSGDRLEILVPGKATEPTRFYRVREE